MFTGIITDVDTLTKLSRKTGGEWGDTRFEVSCSYDPATIDIGASIALAGACMTVIELTPTGQGCIFAVEVSDESLDKTTLSSWQVGTRMNLERAMKVGDEYGGHMVSGHVDARARVKSIEPIAGSLKFTFEAPDELMFGIAPKGSVTLNGVSLTVNEVGKTTFTVNVIPHTAQVTTIGVLQPNDEINLEIDTIARYVARYTEHMKARADD